MIAAIALFGGVGLAGQTLVAQAFGGRRNKRAAQAGWLSVWAALMCAPIFIIIALNGDNLVKLGAPMGVLIAADVLGFAMFQLMQVRLGTIDGAATQIVMMLTSISFMPAIGIAMAGTTLVGQSIGMGDRAWARKVGNSIIVICMTYMGTVGLLLGLTAPWRIPAFVGDNDPQAFAVIQLGVVIIWVAAAYQLFDGLNFGCSFSLRGAGDALVPAGCVLALSWIVFVPLAHMLSFKPGDGWVDGLPQLGLGALGGWVAALTYIVLNSLMLLLRWRSHAWENIRLR